MKEKKSLHFKLFSLLGTARFEHIMVADMVIMVVDAAFERHHGSWTLVGPILDIGGTKRQPHEIGIQTRQSLRM